MHDALLEPCITLALRAGEAIMRVYADPFEVEHKADASPLTAADMAAHRILVAGLHTLTPELPVLSEESAAISWSERRAWTRYWLVDPLDGTREFVKRNGEFTVNIALIDGDRPVLGVVHAPALGETAFARRGVGAFARHPDGDTPLHVRRPEAPLRVAASRSHLDARTAAALARMGEPATIGLGSSLKFLRIAAGEIDVYPRFGPTSEWDTAAAQCILEAAGGGVLALDGTPLRYNRKDSLLNPEFIALGDASLPWREWLA